MRQLRLYRAVVLVLAGTMTAFSVGVVLFRQSQGEETFPASLRSAMKMEQVYRQMVSNEAENAEILNQLSIEPEFADDDNWTETTYVVVLAYQRSGSTFFGSLFNLNSKCFYQFEPLDSLYSYLYGTASGWNAPSDITTYSNGTARTVPAHEVTAVSTFLSKLFSCDFQLLPTEYLTHTFWYLFINETTSTAAYGQCLHNSRLIHRQPGENVTKFCGQRFGWKTPERMSECLNLLTNADFRSKYKNQEVAEQFHKHRHYMDQTLRGRVQSLCLPKLQQACNTHSLRVVKTVRATMDSMESLMQRLPNVKVVHLVRDPRPVALSRIKFTRSARSMFSMQSNSDWSAALIREAAVYCRRVVDDVIARRRLERLFPGRILSLTYEQLLGNVWQTVNDVHHFIGAVGASARNAARKFALQTTEKSSKRQVTKWLKGELTPDELLGINKECSRVFEFYQEYENLTPQFFRD